MQKNYILKKNKQNTFLLFSFVVLIFLILVVYFGNKIPKIFASIEKGSIDNTYKYAKGTDNNSDIKINFNLFEGALGVVVSDTELAGFAWGTKIGWINLSPSGSGVLNDTEGILSGYATSQSGGWIDFSGVTINSSGEFIGYANSQIFGKIIFNCSTNNTCATDDFKVLTDWRSVSVRNGTSPNHIKVDPGNPPIVSVEDPTLTKESTPILPGPKPLPINNIDQYENGGDVIKNHSINDNNGNTKNGQTTVILTPEQQDIKVGIDVNNLDLEPTVTGVSMSNTFSSIGDKVQNISKTIELTTKKIKNEATLIADTPVFDFSTKAVGVVGVAGGGTVAVTSFTTSALSFSEFLLTFFRIWSILSSALGFKKHRKQWGTVYDSVTKQPLDPAYIILKDKRGNEIATSITDLNGRFGFLVPPGKYQLVARKTNYVFPSSKLFNKYSDELYNNLYFGEMIETEEDKTIVKNIPMDPKSFDWNEFTKRDKNLLKYHSSRASVFTQISNALFYFGLVISIILIFIKFDIFNIIMFAIYTVLVIIRRVDASSKSYGTITHEDSGYPISYAIIRVFSEEKKKEIFHRVADQYGHYYCLLPKGEYYITIEKKNADESYSKIYKSEIIYAKKGIINQDFSI